MKNAATQENTKILLRETTREKTLRKFVSIEFDQDNIKPKQQE